MRNFDFIELSELCDLEKGKTGLMKAKEGIYPLVATGKNRRTCDTYQFDTKAVCIPLVSSTGHGHASLKYVHYQEGKFALGTILVAVIPKDENVINAQFLHLYLSRLKDTILVPLMTGAANVTLTVTKLKTVKVPLPDIEEQLRIVSLFNRMDNEQVELINEISTQQTLLKKLRQSILQEAIEGKLTTSWREQNPDVESASVLLEKIKAEKEQLIKEKKIKKQKPLPPINEDEIPFDIPDGWVWCRLGEITNVIAGNNFNSLDFNNKGGVKTIKITNAGVHKLVETNDYLPNNFKVKYSEYLVKENDLIIALTRPYIVNGLKVSKCTEKYNNSLLNQRVASIRNIHDVNNEYLYFYMKSDFVLNGYKDRFEKINLQPNLKMSDLTELNFSLPSLKEQKAIVKKIENLFKICDELETQINSSKTNSQTLMQAVLKEAFEG